ncbi:MAG: MoxR family ATPase [Candidatus Gracilibacteria bacterium]|nr:MoxR family ATPase [Candidatus Gracilibacteria bacterium]
MENTELLQEYLSKIQEVRDEINKKIIGQEKLIDNLLIGILANGHMLLEGVPGLAKTFAVETLAQTLGLDFQRIQFTPDLLPSDLIGGQIYNQAESKFYTKKGPIFTNFLLTDEINRAPTKIHSALLEAMQEKQVTIGDETFILDRPFFVLATQNPIEQEGTYPLPEAQLDRFLLKILIKYPKKDEEIKIMKDYSVTQDEKTKTILKKTDLLKIQEFIEKNIFVDEKIYEYVRDLVFATRNPEEYGLANLKELISLGASPRASIAMIKASKVVTFLSGRDYVIPEDIKSVIYEVLRHRIILSFEAIGENTTQDDLIKNIISNVKVP